MALLRQHVLDDRLHLAGLGRVEEGVDLEDRLLLLQLVLDVRVGDRLVASEVHDLDALALLDVEDHDLALGPVVHAQDQVLQEARVPEAAEVVLQPPLVVALPRLGRHVEEEGLRLQELVALDRDALHDGRGRRRRRGQLLGRGRHEGGDRQEKGEHQAPGHALRLPPRPSCQYHRPPSSTPISMARCGRIWPRMKASESVSSMCRWMARRSGRAP